MCYCFIDILKDRMFVQKNRHYVLIWSLGIGFLLGLNRTESGVLSWFMLILQSILIFVSVLKKNREKSWFSFCIILAYNVCLAFLQLLFVFIVVTLFSKINIRYVYFNSSIFKSACCLLSLLTIYLLYVIILKYRQVRTASLDTFSLSFFLYSIAGIWGIASFQTQLMSDPYNRNVRNIIYLSMIIISTLLILIGSIKNAETKTELELSEFKNKLLEENYQEIQNMYQNYACTYHDMKNHLLILGNYCKAGDTEKALHYIEEIQAPIQSVERSTIYSGNRVLDIVMNFKLSEAKKRGISTEAIIEGADEMLLCESDLCAILSNLLDNAIEACEFLKAEEKWIRVLVKRMGDMLLIQVSNSCSEKNQNEKGKYRTSKIGMHGYGIKSVKAKVEKYGGEVNMKCSQGVFTATVTFFNVIKIAK